MIAVDLLEGFYDEDEVRSAYPAQFDAAMKRRDELLAELRTRSDW